jgi:flagellar L-ring protein FlgH
MNRFLRGLTAPAVTAMCALGWSAGVSAHEGDQPLLQRSLFADRKAFRPGDILTVLITEQAAATATARTRADKDESVFADVRHSEHDPWHIDLAWGNDFNGGGQIQRTGRLVAKLAVVVQGVDADGNLSISGEQNIYVNNEQQRIALSGTIRLDDIAPDNTVASARIANAHIDFKGDGILARKQSPGLLTKLFDLFGLN